MTYLYKRRSSIVGFDGRYVFIYPFVRSSYWGFRVLEGTFSVRSTYWGICILEDKIPYSPCQYCLYGMFEHGDYSYCSSVELFVHSPTSYVENLASIV